MVAAFQLDSAVREARARTRVPGVAAGLSVAGEATAVADGVLELGRPERVRVDTSFRIASVSKPFTAALAAACLPLEGRIVALLGHTAGLRQESERPLPRQVEGLWSYSNSGYWRAGALCADACGTSFAEAMRARVLEPLGLRSTGYEEPEAPARGHVQEGETGHRPVPDDRYPAERWPSGGLWSTVGDLLRFGERQLEARSTLFEPRADALGARYALGWWVRTRADGSTVYDHEGSVAGYQSLLLLVPEQRIALVVLTNSWRGSGLVRRVVARLGLLPGGRLPQRSGEAPPGDVAGTYALDGTEAVVEPRGDGLDVTGTETDPVAGVRRSTRYPAEPLGGGVYGFAGGVLMSHRLDFPRPGVARIGWTAMLRAER